jgi:GPH family glycoside/pentoside/hexuronide:cation symporter
MGSARLSRSIDVGYAVGSIGTAAFATVPGLLLLYYLTNVLGVAAGLAGAVVLLPKFWDVLVNPLVGSLSDRTRTRWGSRRPWMLAGGLVLPVLFFLMFSAPAGSPTASAAYVALLFLLSATAYACFQVPYLAMPAEITDDYDERSTLMSYRVALLALGILLAGAAAPAIVQAAGGGRNGYRLMSLFVAGLLTLGLVGAVVGTRRTRQLVEVRSEHSLIAQLRMSRGNRPFLVLLATFVMQALATGTMLAAVQYFSSYVLHRPGASSILFVCLVAPAILVMPLWSRVSRRAGKLPGLVAASIIFAIGAGSLLAGGVLPLPVVYVQVGLIGVGYAGMQMFPLSMLPDTIAADTARTGIGRAGVFTGLWTAGETAGLALGPGLLGLILALTGFVSSEEGRIVAQPDSARLGVLLGFSVVPAAIVVTSLFFARKYDLTANRLQALIATSPTGVTKEVVSDEPRIYEDVRR